MKEDTTLDLHRLRHHEVPRKIDQFIGDHMLRGTRSVQIITGNSDKMKQIVNETLNDYQLTSTTEFNNNGSVIVDLT